MRLIPVILVTLAVASVAQARYLHVAVAAAAAQDYSADIDTPGPSAPAAVQPVFDIAPDITTNAQVQQDLERASRHWHARPCPNVTVGLMRDDTTVARAQQPGCRMWIAVGWWIGGLRADARFMCNVIVHEYGHMLGHTHSDPDLIMRPVDLDGKRWVRECRRARTLDWYQS